jgi:hypothetical protein
VDSLPFKTINEYLVRNMLEGKNEIQFKAKYHEDESPKVSYNDG